VLVVVLGLGVAIGVIASRLTAVTLVAVPRLRGMSEAAASNDLGADQLALGTVTNAASTTVARGEVIATSPAAGTKVAIRSRVDLIVSSGPPRVVVPILQGLSVAAASNLLGTHQLVLGAVSYQTSTNVPSGDVLATLPAAGTEVAPGSAVALVIARAPAPTATAHAKRKRSS